MKCYQCPNPTTGEHKVTILGQYDQGTRDKVVGFCKSCYDELLERKRRKAKREAFKYRNAREPTQEQIEQDLNREYENSVRR